MAKDYFRPRLGSNSSLQPIGKIKRNSWIAIIMYEHLFSEKRCI